MNLTVIAQCLALLDVGLLVGFSLQLCWLRRKRRKSQRVTNPERNLYTLLAVGSAGALLSFLVGEAAAGLLPF